MNGHIFPEIGGNIYLSSSWLISACRTRCLYSCLKHRLSLRDFGTVRSINSPLHCSSQLTVNECASVDAQPRLKAEQSHIYNAARFTNMHHKENFKSQCLKIKLCSFFHCVTIIHLIITIFKQLPCTYPVAVHRGKLVDGYHNGRVFSGNKIQGKVEYLSYIIQKVYSDWSMKYTIEMFTHFNG